MKRGSASNRGLRQLAGVSRSLRHEYFRAFAVPLDDRRRQRCSLVNGDATGTSGAGVDDDGDQSELACLAEARVRTARAEAEPGLPEGKTKRRPVDRVGQLYDIRGDSRDAETLGHRIAFPYEKHLTRRGNDRGPHGSFGTRIFGDANQLERRRGNRHLNHRFRQGRTCRRRGGRCDASGECEKIPARLTRRRVGTEPLVKARDFGGERLAARFDRRDALDRRHRDAARWRRDRSVEPRGHRETDDNERRRPLHMHRWMERRRLLRALPGS